MHICCRSYRLRPHSARSVTLNRQLDGHQPSKDEEAEAQLVDESRAVREATLKSLELIAERISLLSDEPDEEAPNAKTVADILAENVTDIPKAAQVKELEARPSRPMRHIRAGIAHMPASARCHMLCGSTC